MTTNPTAKNKPTSLQPKQRTLSCAEQLKTVLRDEADALKHVVDNFPQAAEQLVHMICNTTGRLIFTGMGKSGLVARKLVATFSSMKTPSFFLHPSEALHGDLGMAVSGDVCIVLSKSGTGSELEMVVPRLQERGIRVALITCQSGVLTNFVDLTVVLPFDQEACLYNLAPTSSTTLTMAFGDALSVVVADYKGFTQNDFARLHPAGALGKNLLLSVQSFMMSPDVLSLLAPDTPFKDVIVSITEKKLGVGIVCDASNKMLGIITDGDLRRACEKGQEVFSTTAQQIMTRNPKTIRQTLKASLALEIMETYNITSLVVTDDSDTLLGLVHLHDLVKAGIRSS